MPVPALLKPSKEEGTTCLTKRECATSTFKAGGEDVATYESEAAPTLPSEEENTKPGDVSKEAEEEVGEDPVGVHSDKPVVAALSAGDRMRHTSYRMYDLAELQSLQLGTTAIRTIGLVQHIKPCETGVTKSGRRYVRRDVELVSPSGAMYVTIWGRKASEFSSQGKVIVVIGAKLKKFEGTRHLSLTGIYEVEPDLYGVKELKSWAEQRSVNPDADQFLHVVQQEVKLLPPAPCLLATASNLLPPALVQGAERSH